MTTFADRPVVLFDFDGTIADTGPAVVHCAAGALRAHGIDPDEVGDLRRFIGPPLVNGFMEVAGVTRDEALTMVATYRALFAEEVGPADYPVLPGIAELLLGLKARGARIAVATSRLESSARAMLSTLDLPAFDAIAGRLEPGRDTKEESIRAALDPSGRVGCRGGARGRSAVTTSRGRMRRGVPCIGIYQDEAARAELAAAGADALCAGAAEAAPLLGA